MSFSIAFIDRYLSRPNKRHVSTDVRTKVRSNGSCWYCYHRFAEGEIRYVEHVYPVSRRGTNRRRNLRAACFPCNSVKSNKTYGWTRPPMTNSGWRQYNQDVRNGVRRDRRAKEVLSSR